MSAFKKKPALPAAGAVKFFAASLLVAAAAPAALAQSIWTEGHGDIGIHLDNNGDLHAHWHLGGGTVVNGTELDNGGEFEPDELIAFTNTLRPAPDGSANWLGVAAGSSVYRAGNSLNQPNVGFGAEEIGSTSDWLGYGISVTLSSWSTPAGGNFALVNGSDVYFSTFNPASTQPIASTPGDFPYNPLGNNSIFLYAGDHEHFAFFFSQAGYYELTLTWSGTHNQFGYLETTETFGFQVGAIPEPSTWALLLGSATGLGVLIVRRRKRA